MERVSKSVVGRSSSLKVASATGVPTRVTASSSPSWKPPIASPRPSPTVRWGGEGVGIAWSLKLVATVSRTSSPGRLPPQPEYGFAVRREYWTESASQYLRSVGARQEALDVPRPRGTATDGLRAFVFALTFAFLGHVAAL